MIRKKKIRIVGAIPKKIRILMQRKKKLFAFALAGGITLWISYLHNPAQPVDNF